MPIKVKFALILVRFYAKIALKSVQFGIFCISLYPHLSKKTKIWNGYKPILTNCCVRLLIVFIATSTMKLNGMHG